MLKLHGITSFSLRVRKAKVDEKDSWVNQDKTPRGLVVFIAQVFPFFSWPVSQSLLYTMCWLFVTIIPPSCQCHHQWFSVFILPTTHPESDHSLCTLNQGIHLANVVETTDEVIEKLEVSTVLNEPFHSLGSKFSSSPAVTSPQYHRLEQSNWPRTARMSRSIWRKLSSSRNPRKRRGHYRRLQKLPDMCKSGNGRRERYLDQFGRLVIQLFCTWCAV